VEAEEMAIARQWLDKHVPAVTNTYATIEELLDAVFSMQSVSYQIINSVTCTLWLASKATGEVA
jgi:hypothetical protein